MSREGAAIAPTVRLVVAFTHFAREQPGRYAAALIMASAMALFLSPAGAAAAGTADRTAPGAGQAAPAAATPPAVTSPISLPNRKIDSGDLLSIAVFEEPELSESVRVAQDGTVAMPLVTRKLRAAGLLPREVEAEITRELPAEKLVLHPVVNVSILEYAPRYVSVLGDVKTPGRFEIAAPVTLLEALAKAGWITDRAAPELLLTTPGSPTPRKIDIARLQTLNPAVNVTLTGGEVIEVPDARKQLAARFPDGPKVWITGNVSRPQAYSIVNPADASVLKAVVTVLGTAPDYEKTAFIYRVGKGGTRFEIQVPLREILRREAQDMPLQTDDVLFIPGDSDKKLQQYYSAHPPSAPWDGLK